MFDIRDHIHELNRRAAAAAHPWSGPGPRPRPAPAPAPVVDVAAQIDAMNAHAASARPTPRPTPVGLTARDQASLARSPAHQTMREWNARVRQAEEAARRPSRRSAQPGSVTSR